MNNRPADISLPEGWDWDRVEAARKVHAIPDHMVPVVAVQGVAVAWITLNAAREDQRADIEPGDDCSGQNGHEWAYTGTEYGGDDESYRGEGRCYCVHCGADGDA